MSLNDVVYVIPNCRGYEASLVMALTEGVYPPYCDPQKG